jgi:hypothetical protein
MKARTYIAALREKEKPLSISTFTIQFILIFGSCTSKRFIFKNIQNFILFDDDPKYEAIQNIYPGCECIFTAL